MFELGRIYQRTGRMSFSAFQMGTALNQWRPPQVIRPLAIGLIRRGDEILVMAVKDDQGRIKGWRPPGGGIEFGESAEQAVARELLEELGEPVVCGRRLCVLENIFMHEGSPGHEVVFVFEVNFAKASAYATKRYAFIDQGIANEVVWRKVAELADGTEPLFPDSLRDYLWSREICRSTKGPLRCREPGRC